MTEADGAVFVMPRTSTEWASAPAIWITVAGWADATRKRFGHAWIVTRDRVSDPEEAYAFTRPRPPVQHAYRRIPAPAILRTGVKDLVRARAARRHRDVAERAEWRDSELAFVWQHHDILHSAGEPLARRHHVPLVSYVHAPQVWESARWGVHRPGWGTWLERFGEGPQLRRSDVVACVSEEVVAEVLRLGVDERRVLVSPMAVDADRFTPSVSSAGVRQQFGLVDAFVVGWTGSFRSFHGLETALDAFAVLRRRAPESRLLLVGDGSARAGIEQHARSLGVRDAVVFAGAVAHEDLPPYIAAMDATVVTAQVGQPFHYSPQKMREYLAVGRPVVAPRVGDIARTLTDDVDGLLYAVGDVASFADRLITLRDDAVRRDRLGRAGRALMERTGTWDARLDELLTSDAFQLASPR
jgi:glycosyltransferase involved in cell wall biosynthesis